MSTSTLLPTWAPRVKQSLVQQLYENDAQGIYDDELLDEIGWALFHRCQSFLDATAAVAGRALCPACGEIVAHHAQPDEILSCRACGWAAPWKDYFRTIQHRQLSGAEPVQAFFKDFNERFPKAKDPQDKMLLIDRLIHGWHWNALFQMNTRAAGINLIEGNYHQVIEFLDQLSYGPGSTPGVREEWQDWRTQLNQTAERWCDERLRRQPK
jgi:hypothetical protein